MCSMSSTESRWLLLIHQIPPKPNYFRVKIWRRLQRLGAVAVKNSVYVLPKSDQAQEDFQWVLREIVERGGEASLCEARFVEGLSDEGVEALFKTARDADYSQIAGEARRISEAVPTSLEVDEGHRAQLESEILRLRRRLTEVASIDFFGAPGHLTSESLVTGLEERLQGLSPDHTVVRLTAIRQQELRGRTWVTRKGVYIDRMASTWLIRRFVDPDASFKFVPAKGYRPRPGELRFDMFDAEFTHEGDYCTFEILIKKIGLGDPALRPIAEIVHDIDLKDTTFTRPETAGIEGLMTGIAMGHKDDEGRLSRAFAVFDDLYEYFRRKRS
jgi:hypothetical protein